jgi:hypothetical protein
MDLTEWIGDNSDQIKTIADVRNIDINMIKRVLEIVKEFIISRKLIVYGGQSIDYALRLKGSSIYHDSQIPDLDFLSTRNVDDGYDLTDILIKKGFKNVNSVHGLHIQTMKVRVDSIWVADISYVPDKVFKLLPTIKYNGMNILHPDYQRSDMHLAFCFPYANPPREDIFNRFKKDVKRFNIIQQYYPMDVKDSNIIECTESKTFKLDSELIKGNNALHGFAAYNIYVSEYNKIINKTSIDLFSFDESGVTIKFPKLADMKLQIASSNVNKFINIMINKTSNVSTLSDVKSYSSFIEFQPIRHEFGDYIVYSVENQLLSITEYEGFKVVNIQYLLMDFLYRYFTSEGDLKELYYNLYADTLRMLIEVTSKYTDEYRLFKLLDTTMGCNNYSQAHYVVINKLMKSVDKICPKPSDEILNILENHYIDKSLLPKPYYPPSFANHTKKHPKFNYYASEEFQRDGHLFEKIETTTTSENTTSENQISGGGSIMDFEGSNEIYEKTYCIEFKQLNRIYLDKILKSTGWTSVTLEDVMESKQVGILATENKASWDKRLYDVHSNIKSRLDAHNITQKVELHKSLLAEGVNFVPKTYLYKSDKSDKSMTDLSTGTKINFDSSKFIKSDKSVTKFIWRPEGGFGGRGIAVFNTMAELNKIILAHNKLFPKESALISEYIHDTMLIKLSDDLDYKFHIRMYLIIAIVPDAPGLKFGTRAALCKYGEIANADKPFNLQTTDLAVHNTHIRSTKGVRFPDNYPGGIEKGMDILKKSAKILSYVCKLLMKTVKPYEESNGGYEILGVDMMVKKLADGSEQPMLIEINTKTGYGLLKGDTQERKNWLSKFILGGVAEILLDDIKFKDSNIIHL